MNGHCIRCADLWWPLALLCFSICYSTVQANELNVACYDDVRSDYAQFIGTRDPLTLTDYSGPYTRHEVVELVLIQQALALGGYPAHLNLHSNHNTYQRNLELLRQGSYPLACHSVWEDDVSADPRLFHTQPLIHKDNFIIGLYARIPENQSIRLQNRLELSRYRLLCNPQWTQAYQILKHMGVNCVDSNHWPSMVEMLSEGRADLILSPFQATPDNLLEVYGHSFAPVPGVRLHLGMNRVLAISARHPEGEKIHQALLEGLGMLEKRGIIRQAYTDSGFYNKNTSDWKLLNPNLENEMIAPNRAP